MTKSLPSRVESQSVAMRRAVAEAFALTWYERFSDAVFFGIRLVTVAVGFAGVAWLSGYAAGLALA